MTKTVEAPKVNGRSRLGKILDANHARVTLKVHAVDIRHIEVPIVSDAPLISHKWSEKAKKQMLDKQMGAAPAPKEFKNPEEDFQSSLYTIDDPHEGEIYVFPSIAFKKAMVDASTQLKGFRKTNMRQAFHIEGEFVKIIHDEPPEMREDMVRLSSGVADIRYRASFAKWAAIIPIRYNASVITDQQIAQLLEAAGFGIGVGEWRPQRNGWAGLFHVAREGEL